MKIPRTALTKGAVWTIGSFGAGQVIRFGTNVALTRLLAPELFGIMVIVNALKAGVELMSDLGIGQSIVQNKDAEDLDFYQTAWTLQCLRGLVLWAVACAMAPVFAHYYGTPILLTIVPVASFVLVLNGFTSINPPLLQRRLQISTLLLYEMLLATVWAVGQVTLAYFMPTIWSLVLGLIFGSVTSLIGSHFLFPRVPHRFRLARRHVWQILHFGKWVFLASFVYFLSINFDRLYLAGVIPFALLGVYGISRSISELLSILALRLGNVIVFPFISSHAQVPRAELRAQLSPLRLVYLLIAAFGFAVCAATIDLAIKIIFDQRYHDAGWMVPILVLGAWIAVLCSLNESTLLGIGQPRYGAIGYSLKFVWLLISLPLSFSFWGAFGCILAVAVSDAFRYVSLLRGQMREGFAYRVQDLFISILMFGCVALLELLRWTMGYGTSFDGLPIFGHGS